MQFQQWLINKQMVSINFYKASNITDKLICFISRGKYCHVNLTVNGVAYEAKAFSKVRKFVLNKRNNRIDSFKIDLTKYQELGLVEYLENQLGKHYDYIGLLGFIFYINFRANNSNKLFCSELVFEALKHVGVLLLDRVKGYKISPVILSYSPVLK